MIRACFNLKPPYSPTAQSTAAAAAVAPAAEVAVAAAAAMAVVAEVVAVAAAAKVKPGDWRYRRVICWESLWRLSRPPMVREP